MILVMKAISVSAPRSQDISLATQTHFKSNSLMRYLAWCGYAFSPGSVIFGPWYNFDYYLRATQLTGPSSSDNSVRRCAFYNWLSNL